VVIAAGSTIVGFWLLALIAFALLRAHPWESIGITALLLFALGRFGARRMKAALAVIFAVGACYFFGCLFIELFQGSFPPAVDFGWFGPPLLVLGALALIGLLGFMFGVLIKKGYAMWRRVDRITVADFASVFALFVARVVHYILPAHLPNFINEQLPAGMRDPFSDRGARALWTYVALYVFYKMIKAALFRTLDLNPTPPSAISPVSSSSSDAEPFTPFNPYAPSKNLPLLPR
jgi:hypothetical protein